MCMEDLLAYKRDVFSQFGEDGIIAAIFQRTGTTNRTCCEFGAWDGVHLSNCRSLILDGWRALMIECDDKKFGELVANYRDNPSVICLNRFVDTAQNTIDSILEEHGISDLDFLSIDIDGLDYEIFESLRCRPRVICIEAIPGNDPTRTERVHREVAKKCVGQPLEVFRGIADSKGYGLVCYTTNAFFVLRDVIEKSRLPELSSKQAYEYYIEHLSRRDREWLFLANLGLVQPHHKFANPYLARTALGISLKRAIFLKLRWSRPGRFPGYAVRAILRR